MDDSPNTTQSMANREPAERIDVRPVTNVNDFLPPALLAHTLRGTFPQEHVVQMGSTKHAREEAGRIAAVAFMLGFDVQLLDRVIDDAVIDGRCVLRITQPPRDDG